MGRLENDIGILSSKRISCILLGLLLAGLTVFGQVERVLIPEGAVWFYNDSGDDLGSSWQFADYDHSSWSYGAGILGYGESSIVTQLDYGPDEDDKHITYYFRKEFYLQDLSEFSSVRLGLLRDDGAAIYVNGNRIILSNLPETIQANTYALNSAGGDEESTYIQYSLDLTHFNEGTNLIAVEVHQVNSGSSDLQFDLTLEVSSDLPKTVIINEVIPENHSILMDPVFKQFSDVIELHNVSNKTQDVSSFFISDDPDEPEKWRIPNNTNIPSGGYVIVYADDLDTLNHTSFRLSLNGETIALYNWYAEVIDELSYPAAYPDISYGRNPLDISQGLYFTEPSPGEKNGEGLVSGDRTPLPVFSTPGGKYISGVQLGLSSDGNATIYYTVDGSDPDRGDIIYTSVLSITETKVIKARAYGEDLLPSEVVAHTYLVNEQIDLPVVSIATEEDHLYNNNTGIYLDEAVASRKEWERPASFEFFEPDGSRRMFSQVDIRLFGRGAIYFPAKSLAIFPRETNGKNYFDYPVFPSSELNHFESLIIRTSSDDWRYTLLKDGMVQSVVENQTQLDVQSFRQVILFLNGQYLGIHNIREKYNESYLANHHGVDPNGIDLLFIDNDYAPARIEIKEGDAAAYLAFLSYISSNDLTDDDNFEFVESMIDVNNFIDYIAVQVITANKSWKHNRRVWRPRTPDGKFKWLLFDLDYGHSLVDVDILSRIAEDDPVFRTLITNTSFRNRFIQRVVLLEATVFEEDRVIHFIDSLANNIEPQITRHLDRWGGTHPDMFTSKTEWQNLVNVARSYARNRPDYTEDYLMDYFNLDDRVEAELKVTPAGSGTIYLETQVVTQDELDIEFFKNIPFKLTAQPKPGYEFVSWSGDVNSTQQLITIPPIRDFEVEANFTAHNESDVLITELLYHPIQATGDNGEFIELKNLSEEAIDLSQYSLSGEVNFTFPGGTLLSPNEELVVCKSASFYQSIPAQVFQWNSGTLPDGGGTIILRRPNNQVADQLTYTDDNPWPDVSVLEGASIEVKNAAVGNATAQQWGTSRGTGGTPGLPNSRYFDDVRINEIMANPSNSGYLSGTDWFEISNQGAFTTDLGGLYFSDDPMDPLKWQLSEDHQSITQLKGAGYKVFIADGNPEDGTHHAGFKLSGKGGELIMNLAYPGFVTELDRVEYPVQTDGHSWGRVPDTQDSWQPMSDPTPGSPNHLNSEFIQAPRRVKSGDLMPVYVKVLKSDGSVDMEYEGDKALIASGVSFNPSTITCKKGVGYVLTKVTASDDFELEIAGIDDACYIEVVDNWPTVVLDEQYNTDLTLLSGIQYVVEQHLTIGRHGSLTVEAGAWISLADKVSIKTAGPVEILGTHGNPVVFSALDNDEPWGGLRIMEPETRSYLSHVFFTQGGGDPTINIGHTETQAVIWSDEGDMSLNNVFVFDNTGKALMTEFARVEIDNCLFATSRMGPELRNSYTQVNNTWIMDIPDPDRVHESDDADGIYFWKEYSNEVPANRMENSVLVNVEDDAIDMLTSDVIVKNCFFFDIMDKASSAGYGSDAFFERCVVYDCNTGFASSFSSSIQVLFCTLHKTSRPFLNQAAGGTNVYNSIMTDYVDKEMHPNANAVTPSFFYCLSNEQELPGQNNIFDSPKYMDANDLDFTLQGNSSAIDAADPSFGFDPDGSLPDMGCYPYFGEAEKGLVINEIYYNVPQEQGSDQDYEFIELFNASAEEIDLSGYSIRGGIDFVFPVGYRLEPGGYAVITRNMTSYDHLSCLVFEFDNGKLSNTGELLTLTNPTGEKLVEIEYSDQAPWPVIADGMGFSLELNNPVGDNEAIANWRASYVMWGTPGRLNQVPDWEKIHINEVMVNNVDYNMNEDGHYWSWIELYNGSDYDVNIGGWLVEETNSGQQFVIPVDDPDRTILRAHGYILIYFNDDGGGQNALTATIQLSDSGGKLRIANPHQSGDGFDEIDSALYGAQEENQSSGRSPDGSERWLTFEYPTPGMSNFGQSKFFVTPNVFSEDEEVPVLISLNGGQFSYPEMIHGQKNIEIIQETLELETVHFDHGIGFAVLAPGEEQEILLHYGGDSAAIGYDSYRSVHLKDKEIYRSTTWTADQDYYIMSDLEVPATATIHVEAGTRVFVDPEANIEVYGKLIIQGKPGNPVVFLPKEPDQAWGGFQFHNVLGGSSLSNCFIYNGGGSQDDRTGRLSVQPIIQSFGPLQLNKTVIVGDRGVGILMEQSNLIMTDCILYGLEGGVELDRATAKISSSFFIELEENVSPSTEAFGLLSYGNSSAQGIEVEINQAYFSQIAGDGIRVENSIPVDLTSVFLKHIDITGIAVSGNQLNVKQSVMGYSGTGINYQGTGQVKLDHLSLHQLNTGIRMASQAGGENPQLFLENSILSALDEDIEFVGSVGSTIGYVLSTSRNHDGIGNLLAIPGFRNPGTFDFRLSTGSPGINTGNPASPRDIDGTRTDLGAYPFEPVIVDEFELIITEIQHSPSSGKPEFIEIYNPNGMAVNLDGYAISGSVEAQFGGGKLINPQSYALITSNPGAFDDIDLIFEWDSGDLPSQDGEIEIIGPMGSSVDQVNYSANKHWSRWAVGHGPSLELIDLQLNNDYSTSWRCSYYDGGTPGEPNQIAPQEGIVINEFVARSGQAFLDENGEVSDWIELYNYTNHVVHIGTMAISRDLSLPAMHVFESDDFDDFVILPQGFLLLRADAETDEGTNHLNFLLSGSSGEIGIFKSSGQGYTMMDEISYSTQQTDVSYGRAVDAGNVWQFFSDPTPGASNGKPVGLISGLYINEFIARNSSVHLNNVDQYDDWIEFYNSTQYPINLGGLYITDESDQMTKYHIPTTFPDSTTIPPGGYLMLYPSGKPKLGIQHVEFQLAGSGEYIGISQLYNGSMAVLDELHYPGQTTDVSYGRSQDGRLPWIYFNDPTPLRTNDESSSVFHLNTDNSQMQVYPNPSRGNINVAFTAYETTEIELLLFDALGRSLNLQGPDKQLFMAGAHVIELNLKSLGIPTGSYRIGILMKNQMLTKTIILVN